MSTPAAQVPLIAECVQAGGIVNMFPLLEDWPIEKLNRLLIEIERCDKFAEDTWASLALKAENFMSVARSRELDETRTELMLMLSEIASVAYYYLGQKEERAKQR